MATTTATKKTAAGTAKRAPKANKAAGAAKDKKRSAASTAAATAAPAPTPEPEPIVVDQPVEEFVEEDEPVDVEMGDGNGDELDQAGEASGLENDEADGYGEDDAEEDLEEDEGEEEAGPAETAAIGGSGGLSTAARKGGVSKRKGAPAGRGRSKEVTREYLLSEKDRKDLSSAALRKISLKAGVETLSRTAYDAVRAIFKTKLTAMVNEACLLAGHKSRRTVTTEDAGAATKMFLGSDAAKGDFHKVRRYRRPAPRNGKAGKAGSSDDAGSVASDDVASTITATTVSTARRVGAIGGDQSSNRPRGAVTKERIAEYSNQSRDTVFIPLEAFSRILHRINDTEYKCKGVELNGKRLSAFRWQPEAVHMVHHALEVIATNLFRSALLLARTRERKSVTAADVDTVVELNSNFAAVRA